MKRFIKRRLAFNSPLHTFRIPYLAACRGRNRARLLRCDQCGADYDKNPGPMLYDKVWKRIAKKLERLCDSCIRRRLGRPILSWYDCTDCPFNYGWWRWLSGRFS